MLDRGWVDVDRATNQRKSPEEGGKVPEVAKVVEGAVVGGVEAEVGDGAEELVDEWPWMGNIFITMKSISKYKYSYIY